MLVVMMRLQTEFLKQPAAGNKAAVLKQIL